jgi:hypothetical protein
MAEFKRISSLTNWPDTKAKHQIINQVIFDKYITHYEYQYYKQTRKHWPLISKCWAHSASRELLKYGIDVSPGTLRGYLRELKRGTRDATSASIFSGEGLGPRAGKEEMYKQLELLIKLFLKDNPRHYVGLPANQVVQVINKNDSVVACETNKEMLSFMSRMIGYFRPKGATVINRDIISFLNETDQKFNIFDLDLMCYLNEKRIANIASALANSMEDVSVVSLASCVGRKLKESIYTEMMPRLLKEKLKNVKVSVDECYSEKYCDKVVPMRYELIVIRRNDA